MSFGLLGQSDSTWTKSIGARLTSEIIPTTGKAFKLFSIEAKIGKGDNILIPLISRKSIHGIKGNQYGLAYYRKWKWGYTHADLFYSPSLIFPRMVLRSNLFVGLFDGLEASIGASNLVYADGKKLQVLKIGGSYYFGSMMASYSLIIPLSGYLYHSLSLRKYLDVDNDYFQLLVSSGLDNEGLRLTINQPMKVYSMRFSLFKTIAKKTQIQVSFGLIKALSNSENNEYFNYSIGLKRDI